MMPDNTPMRDIVAPAAGPMIESMRAHGYSLATAVADIIDNSISAGAKTVWLDFHWEGAASHVSVLDDGSGMDAHTLRGAMRLGSRSPMEERASGDLGRFGLGLKTASFSQCRRLTVGSRCGDGPVSVRRWDLDHVVNVGDWDLLKTPAPGSEGNLEPLGRMPRGTVVLWEVLDRLVDPGTATGNASAHEHFLRAAGEVSSYLSMVFHRYLEGPSPSLRIHVNGGDEAHRIRAWDPFLEAHPATIATPMERIAHVKGEVRIQGFVLPHKDKLSSQEWAAAAGYGGWNAQQGFYVYRNKRLLVGGSWLGLGADRAWTQEEQYRLARILVDIPTTHDLDWQIDVKKSTGKPPSWLRQRLRALADQTRQIAREVFVHRGAYGPRGPRVEVARAWISRNINGRLVYHIDRKHPLVEAAASLAPTAEKKRLFEAMLRTLEETVPVERIWLDSAEQQAGHSRPFETAEEIEVRRIVEIAYRALRDIHGLKPEAARDRLRKTDGFQDYVKTIDEQDG